VLPRFGGLASREAGRMVLLVVDNSLSMQHRGSGQSAHQRALTAGDQILSTLGAEDVCNIVVAGSGIGTCFFDWSHNHAQARSFLRELKPGPGGADFTAANATAARLLGKESANAEVYYLSDFQRKNWAGVDYTMMPAAARLFWTPATDLQRDNSAVLSAGPAQSRILSGETISVDVELGNYASTPLQSPVRVTIDGSATFERDAFIGPWSSGKVSLPIPAGTPGLHLVEISLPPDDLPEDNRHHFVLNVADKESILLVTDAPQPEKDAPHFLRTALNPYEGREGSLRTEQIGSGALQSGKLAAVKKAVLAKAGPLGEQAAKDLAAFIFNGGGVVWFLDSAADSESANHLRKALGGPLPLNVGPQRVAKQIGTDSQQIARGDFQSKYLRMFRGSRRQDLSLMEFYDIRDCTGTDTGKVLLHFADDTPAMAELTHGLGTLLMLNFSANELSSNLARQRAFPAWLHEIVKHLSAEDPAPLAATIGETVIGEGWTADFTKTPMKEPDGTPLALKTESLGERTGFSFVAERPGFYIQRAGQLLQAFAVNPPADESDLRTLDSTQLSKQTGDLSGHVVQGREDLHDLVNGRPLWHWFILAAIGVLIVEMLFQLWIRRNAST
jgi:hypothetical protein